MTLGVGLQTDAVLVTETRLKGAQTFSYRLEENLITQSYVISSILRFAKSSQNSMNIIEGKSISEFWQHEIIVAELSQKHQFWREKK